MAAVDVVPARTAALVSAAGAVDYHRRRRGSASPTGGAAAGAAAVGQHSGRTCRSLRPSSSSCCAASRGVARRVRASRLAGESRLGWPLPAWRPTRRDCGPAYPCAGERSDAQAAVWWPAAPCRCCVRSGHRRSACHRGPWGRATTRCDSPRSVRPIRENCRCRARS